MLDNDTACEQEGYRRLDNKRTWAVLLVSVLGLFLEMVFIRWIGTEVRIFAYLQNTVLVACFLGLGLGCFTCRRPISLRQTLIPMSFLLLLMAIPFSRRGVGNISELLSVLGDLVIWYSHTTFDIWTTFSFVLIGLVLTYSLLLLIVDVFVPVGRLLGRLMDDHPNTIWAYSVNIFGSLVGTWLLVVLSALYQPPFTWFVIAGVMLSILVFWMRQDTKVNLALATAVIALSWFAGLVPGSISVIWSPYQKLVASKQAEDRAGEYLITVNNVGYQALIDLSETRTASDSDRYFPEQRGLSQYDLPLLFHPAPRKFLVVGAGAGNDAAGGVRHRLKEVTAVEIDPAIISIGRDLHPEGPYRSPAVRIVNDDARSFFSTSQERFDVIAFGLLDSHTTTAMTNARLDHYVYTRESIMRAKSLLAEGGVMALTFEAQKPFIADRMARVLKEVFGKEPLAFRIPSNSYGWGGVMFVTGDLENVRRQFERNPRLRVFIEKLKREYPLYITYTTNVATDDWPYIYLQSREIPALYYILIALMALLFAHRYRRWQATGLISRWGKMHWHFFFLGAAFLLLEVQNISKASVVLGNTWQVNAVIVSGVLSMALLANWVVHRLPRMPILPAYVALIAICLAVYFVDLAQFAFLPYFSKAIVVGCLTSLPMLFSGMVFIRSFSTAQDKNNPLGANLIGALVGALLQSVTFVVGIKALLLLVAGFYLLSLLTLPDQLARPVFHNGAK